MNPDALPLLALFQSLRHHGLPLGVEEYMLALQALRAGFGAENRLALEQLCCTLWAKSDDEARLLRRLLQHLLTQPIVPSQIETESEPIALPSSEPLDISPEQSTEEEASPPSPTLAWEIDEPAQIVQAVRRSAESEQELGYPRFNLLTEYFPVTRRQMKQQWRFLRRMVREGPPEELDIPATVVKIGREAMLLDPVLVPRRRNRAELVLLVDQDGSMVPFHALSRQLIETAQRGGRLGQTGVYYFHDYPVGYLYRDSARLEAHPLSDGLMALKRASVLIISDAGAARGYFDTERVLRTNEFLEQLRKVVRYFAWLNPLPNTRWPGTTASEIARSIPMFELSRHGMQASINVLRGRSV